MEVIPGEASKVWRGCGESKPISQYSYQVKAQGTRHSRCKACMNFEHAMYMQVRTAENPSFRLEYQREWKRKNQNGRRENLKRLYGITLEQYEALLAEQGGKCAICGGVADEGSSMAVDHDHTTRETRGVVHSRCNLAIGFLRDSPRACRGAAEYLERYGKVD